MTPEHDHVTPGERCPTCERRVPHPKQKTSPKSRVSSYRIPVDETEQRAEDEVHYELREAAAEALGILGTKHWQWRLHSYAYALILQGARLTETGG